MRLVNEHVVNPQLVEDQAVVFLLRGQQVLEPLLALGFLLLQVFEDVAVRAGRLGGSVVAQQLVIGGNLLPQKALLKRRDMPMRSKELWVVRMPSHTPLAIFAVRSLRGKTNVMVAAGMKCASGLITKRCTSSPTTCCSSFARECFVSSTQCETPESHQGGFHPASGASF